MFLKFGVVKRRQRDYWFKYGPGVGYYQLAWVPISWQGWLLTIAYMLGLVFLVLFGYSAYMVRSGSFVLSGFVVLFLLLNVIYFYICSKKGEKE
jgi:hypothetical protein